MTSVVASMKTKRIYAILFAEFSDSLGLRGFAPGLGKVYIFLMYTHRVFFIWDLGDL